MKDFKKKPTMGVKLGTVDDWEIRNVNGRAYAIKYNTHTKTWFVSDNHIGMGYMLRRLGIEAAAGGNIFRHYTLPKNAFKGKNREEIIALQNKVI
jgi:hypothetical protein